MLNEEREVKMINEDGTLSKPFTYNAGTPENWAEAVEMLGESNAFSIFLAGLKVKQDNVARNAFRAGKSQEEVEAIVDAWRPGGQRASKKAQATQLMLNHAATINSNPDLRSKVQKAFIANDYDTIIELLS